MGKRLEQQNTVETLNGDRDAYYYYHYYYYYFIIIIIIIIHS